MNQLPRPISPSEYNDVREQFCAAATTLLLEHGEQAFSMRTLAKQVGRSPMWAYRFFRSKEELIAAIRTRAFDQFSECLEEATATNGTALEKATAGREAYVSFAIGNPSAYRLMFEMGTATNSTYPELARASARAQRTMTDGVRALIAAGLLKGNAKQLGRLFWAGLHGIMILSLSGYFGNDDPRRMASRMVTALYQGLVAESATAHLRNFRSRSTGRVAARAQR